MEWQLDKIDNFIQTHLEEDFSLADVSNAVGYSPYHLSREFKGLTGRTLMNYVREKKITAAAKRIATGENILETALAFGFDTHSGFTRAFLEVLGCSPQEYYQYNLKMKQKGECIMDLSTLKVRLVCKDDRDSLWENVYSAMTPRQIKKKENTNHVFKSSFPCAEGFILVCPSKLVVSNCSPQVFSFFRQASRAGTLPFYSAVPFRGIKYRLISAFSRASKEIFLSMPPAYPVRLPLLPTTR